jgi:hypothetical protein
MTKAFTVRGRKFKTDKGCAKAFGLSVKHVRAMRAAGRVNYIGIGGRPKSPLDKRMKVTVRGVTFPTAEACAAHFKITVSTVYRQVSTGRADRIGLGKGKGNRGRVTGRGKVLKIGPFTFPSLQSASLFLGYSKGYVAMALKGANKCSMKSVIARAMAKAAEMDAAQRHARLKEQVAA